MAETQLTGATASGVPANRSAEGLVRAIGRWSLAALIVNCIIGSGVFGLPSAIAALLGRASILAVLIAALAMGVIMACVAEVSSRFTETGGPYLYAREAFGRFMGVQVAWLLWFVRLTACAANANLFVTYLGQFWAPATEAISKRIILSLLIGILAFINFFGVRSGTRASNAFTAAKLGALGLVCVAGALYLMAAHHVIPPAGTVANGAQWPSAMVLLIFAYGGFEAALVSAGEAKDPRRDMPFGLFTALITCAVIYGTIQWVVVGILPDPGHSARPLADVAKIVFGHIGLGSTGAFVVALGALFSTYGYLSGNMLGTPRITFALAERGDFPAWFGLVHPRFRTPAVATWIAGFVVALPSGLLDIGTFADLSNIGTLFAFVLVSIGVVILRYKDPSRHRGFRCPGGPIIPALSILFCILLMAGLPLLTWIRFFVWLAIGLLIYYFYSRHRSEFAPTKRLKP